MYENSNNNKMKIIKIKMSKYNNYFVTETYDKNLLLNLISKIEYNKIINDANKILSNYWKQKINYEKISENKFININEFCILILIIIYFILIYILNIKNYKKIFYIIIICIGILIFIWIIIYEIFNLCSKFKITKKFSDYINEPLNSYCIEINKKINPNLNFSYNLIENCLNCEIKLNKNFNIIEKIEYEI